MPDDLPKLFFDRPLPEEYRDLVAGRAIACGPDDDALATADGVIAGAVRAWDAAAFALGPRLRVISRTGVGYDNVDVAAARAAGVTVCYAPAAPSVSTAEHTVALIMAVTKRLRALHGDALAGKPGEPRSASSSTGRHSAWSASGGSPGGSPKWPRRWE